MRIRGGMHSKAASGNNQIIDTNLDVLGADAFPHYGASHGEAYALCDGCAEDGKAGLPLLDRESL